MTPFEFEILLHYHVSPTPHRVEIDNPPIWPQTRDWFLNEGLLKPRDRSEYGASYITTERGAAYIKFALDTPLPVMKWVLPSEGAE